MGYSLGEAAKELGVSKPTVQRAIKSGFRYRRATPGT